jgi:hypothetical protein
MSLALRVRDTNRFEAELEAMPCSLVDGHLQLFGLLVRELPLRFPIKFEELVTLVEDEAPISPLSKVLMQQLAAFISKKLSNAQTSLPGKVDGEQRSIER